MQISGDYGTELLIRYRAEELLKDLERRRIVNERLAARTAERRSGGMTLSARLARLFHTFRESRMPSARHAAVPEARAAHR